MKKIIFVAFLSISSASLFAQYQGKSVIENAYNNLYRRAPTAWESIAQNYNNGKWNSYDELLKYVAEYQKTIAASGISFKFSAHTLANNTVAVGIFQNGTQVAVDLVAAGGGNLVAAGGGNLVAAGGGNLVAAGGGNLVAAGGGNIAVSSAMKGASFGGAYTLASVGTKVIKTSGSGALIIR